MLVTSRTNLNRVRAIDLAKKIKLQKDFEKDVTRWYKNVINDIATYYATYTRVLMVTQFEEDLVYVLRKHYKKIADEFKYNIRGSLKATDREIDNLINNRLLDYVVNHTSEQSKIIMGTTQRRVRDAFNETMFYAAREEVALSRDAIAAETRNTLLSRVDAWGNTVAATETQNISETAKLQEAMSLKDAGKQNTVKVWKAVLDEKTRIDHAIADGQTVELNEQFSVGGESLMYPGDTSLGASAGNVIHCYCSVIYQTV